MTSRTDAELLAIVRGERARSLGFDLDPVLTEEREKALYYLKGSMPDVPSLPNRSKAVSTDIADAIETALPDILEIFTAGDDVVAFIPRNEADTEAAQQETDYLHHVVFQDNAGFKVFYDWFRDAMEQKVGVVKYWWEDAPEVEPEQFEGKTLIEMLEASQDGEVTDVEPSKDQEDGSEPLYDFKLTREGPDGRVVIQTCSPDDFTVARDTVELPSTTYCAFRTRVRAQELKADGLDPAKVDMLPPYGIPKNEVVQIARDTAGEHAFPIGTEGPENDLRTVEVVEHFVRLLDGGKLKLYRVYTGGNEAVLLEAEEVERIPFEAITPFRVPHRFYGFSVADKLMEIQRIKTVLTRAALDSVYFSLNQRHYVDMTQADALTVSDLLDNRPGMVVRGQGPSAVMPLQPASSGIDYMGSLEYFSTVGEQRTGLVRNAQGLNPDTLHDTAAGMAAMMSEAQKRVRMIARLFAETGVKGLFLGVHALMRQHSSKARDVALAGRWIPVDPTEWHERNAMTVEIGVGAGGRGQRLAAITQVLNLMGEAFKLFGPAAAAMFPPDKIYKLVSDAMKAGGIKQPTLYIDDPSQQPPPPPQGPSPEQLADQAKQQIEQQRVGLDSERLKFDRERTEAEIQSRLLVEQLKDQRERMELAAKADAEQKRIEMDQEIQRAKILLEAHISELKDLLERQRLQQDGELKLIELQAKYEQTMGAARVKAASEALRAQTDAAIQASESEDAHIRAHQDRQHDANMAVLEHTLAKDAAADQREAEGDERDEKREVEDKDGDGE